MAECKNNFILCVVMWFFAAGITAPVYGSECLPAPALLESAGQTVTVSSVDELHRAVGNLRDNTTLLLKPGRYELYGTLSITADNVTVKGSSCDSVQLVGKGMDNPDHQGVHFGFWISAKNTTIANMSISDFYYHSIQIDGKSDSPHIYNVRLTDAGQQFIKANPDGAGGGVDDGWVEYSILEYSNGPPKTNHDNAGTGYLNGVDVHAGKNWRIKNNVFKNFHTPDSADHLWNAAVLMWRGSQGSTTENNFFFNVDRAIAYGLGGVPSDHRGGVIRNNVVFMQAGLYSKERERGADAPLIVWHSPGTKVLHNTIVTNGNTPFAIESRFDQTNIVIANNLTDAPIVHSDGDVRRHLCKISGICGHRLTQFEHENVTNGEQRWFIDVASGNANLKLEQIPGGAILRRRDDALHDFNGTIRENGVTAGAFETTANTAHAE